VAVELPDFSTGRPFAIGAALVAAVLLFRLRWSVLRTLAVCASLGLVAGLAGASVS
jgi:chromate transporter